MKNKSAGFAWLLPIIILALIGAVGVGAWVVTKKPASQSNLNTNTEQTNQGSQTGEQTTTGGNAEVRLEFPWSKYESTLNVKASTTASQSIGQTINIGGFSKVTTTIGKALNLGGGGVYGNVYVFDSLNLGGNGKIDKLYLESGTSLTVGTGSTIGQKIVLSHNDLVLQAEAAAGINTQPTTTTSTTQSYTPPATSQPSAGATATTTVTTASFAGQWSGTFASSALTGAACKASGPVSLSVSSTGSVTGYATVNGVQAPGTGKVDGSGNLSGYWNYTGTNLSYSGKLNSTSSSGSGTYQNSIGCFGSFTVSK